MAWQKRQAWSPLRELQLAVQSVSQRLLGQHCYQAVHLRLTGLLQLLVERLQELVLCC